LIGTLRKLRIVYYGRSIGNDFLVNNEEEIIKNLLKIVEKKIKKSF